MPSLLGIVLNWSVVFSLFKYYHSFVRYCNVSPGIARHCLVLPGLAPDGESRAIFASIRYHLRLYQKVYVSKIQMMLKRRSLDMIH
jgi:hypothetical protein